MLQIQANKQTMSSLEIAELTGKNHADVMRDIRNILNEAEIDASKFASIYLDSMNREKPCYNLPRRECDLVIAGYSVKYRLAIIDRWQELESQKITLPNFSDPIEAARAWADAKEAENSAILKLESVKPQLEFHAAVTDAINAQSIEEVAKVLGTGRNRLFNWLRESGFLNVSNLPYQQFIDRQFFRVTENAFKDKKGESHTYTRTLVTGKGLAYIQSRLMAEAL